MKWGGESNREGLQKINAVKLLFEDKCSKITENNKTTSQPQQVL